MKKFTIVILAAVFFTACGPRAAQLEGTQVEIAQLLSNPAEFANQQVQFTGIISYMCPVAGDKIKVVAQGAKDQAILVVLGEHAAQFSPEMEGKEITLSGLVKAKECTHKHEAPGCGQAAPAADCCGTKPETCCKEAAAPADAAPADVAPAQPVAEAADPVAAQPEKKECGKKSKVYVELTAFEVK